MKTNFFKLTCKKLWIIIVSGFISILLHNFWYAIFHFEEPVFLSLTFIIIIYFIISLIYTLLKQEKSKKKK